MPISLPSHWSARSLSTLRRQLLAWFDEHQRVLPWRQSRDAYRIWISEVMLQQTTVAAVVPYFERFLAAFPTVRDLAAADEAKVLKLWEGLGYYRRARHLHAAARQIVSEHAGEFPQAIDAATELPGVGRYILGAVLSQAYEQRLPIVEANSLRVLARLFGYAGDPREGEGKAWVWQAATDVLPTQRIGDFNQAMMELGALVCTPTAPKCGECPLAKLCTANRDATHDRIPPAKKPPTLTQVREVAVVIPNGHEVLVCQRPSTASRWANLWEFPHGEVLSNETLDEAAIRIANELTSYRVRVVGELTTVKHGITRYAITMTALRCERVGRGGRYRSTFYADARWCAPTELAELPTNTPQRQLFNAAATQDARLF
jgi:A/G-specific adenine glycosylase